MPGTPGFVPGGPYGAQPQFQIPGYAAMSASGFGMPTVVSPPQHDWETAWVAFCREKLTAPGAAVLAHSVYQILAGLGCDKALILSFAEGEYTWSMDQQANAIIKSFVQYLRAQMGSHRLIKELDGGRLEIVSAGGIKEIRNLDGTSDVAVNDILDSAFETYKRNGKFSEPVSLPFPTTTPMPPRSVLQALQRDEDQRTGRGNFFLFPCDPIHPVFSEQGAVSRCSVKFDTYENVKMRYCFVSVLDWYNAVER